MCVHACARVCEYTYICSVLYTADMCEVHKMYVHVHMYLRMCIQYIYVYTCMVDKYLVLIERVPLLYIDI